MSARHSLRFLLIAAAWWLMSVVFLIPPATAAPPAVVTAANTTAVPTSEQLNSKIQELDKQTTLTAEQKTRLLDYYRGIVANNDAIATFNQQAASYRAALNTAPTETTAVQTEFKRLMATPPVMPTLPKKAQLSDIEQLLARELSAVTTLSAQQIELEQQLEQLPQQPTTTRPRLAAVQLALEQQETELKQPAPASFTPAEQQARSWALVSQRERLRSESLMLEQELLSAAVRTELAIAQRERNQLTLQRLQARVEWLENAANRQRRNEAEQAQAETRAAERELADAHPIARQLAKDNALLSARMTELTAQLTQLAAQQNAMEQQRQQIEQDFRDARQRLAVGGLNHALGQILIDQRNQLPDPRLLNKQLAQRAVIISDTTLNQIRLREQLRQLTGDAPLESYLQSLPAAERTAALRRVVREQLTNRVELLQNAIAIDGRYLRALSDVDERARQLLRVALEYDQFLAEHLLWVRSIVPVTQQSWGALPAAIVWLLSPAQWREIASVFYYELKTVPLFWLGGIVASIIFIRARAIRRAIRQQAAPLRRVSSDRFHYTLIALGWTLLLALPWSLLFALIGWRLHVSLEATLFTKAIGQALLRLATMLYGLRVFSLLCMSTGVADSHFRWHSDSLVLLRRALFWATAVLIPLGFVATAVYHHPEMNFSGTVGRLALVAYMVMLTFLTVWIAHPRTGAFRHLLAAHPHGWPNRLRYVWYPALIAVPVSLALLALTGYLYTAGMLLKSLIGELWLVLALIVIQQLIVRWLSVTRRSLALQAALDAQAQREQERDETADTPLPEEEIDLAALDEQTRRLVNSLIVITGLAALWTIWSDVLPALSLFERITLWQYSTVVAGNTQVVPVTLADLALVSVVIMIAIVAARHLPALLEIVLLRHTAVSAGSRYTVITLTGYAITAAGILFTAGTLGFSWSEVQWLVAALSVGIGFGLQEIVANFISGLIILLERPIRVGDVVTIGDITGAVTKINIRATTIRNWDRQELLVPNKEFITGRLLNWTLTDTINRVVITIGIDYEADVRHALAVLLRIVENNPRVLAEPAPLISFEGFGDNALILVVRCYLDSLEHRTAVTTELHQSIHDSFRAADINIAYPQRDIHVRSAQPLEVCLIHHPAPVGG